MGRDYVAETPRRPLRPAGPARRQGRRPHLRRGQRRRRASARLWRRHRLRLVPDHALHLAGRGLHAPLPEAPRRAGDRQGPLRDHPGRGRDRLDRHRHRRRLERRARLHRHLRPRHLADEGVHRPRLFRRDPGGDLRRPARRPLHRHADPHAAVRHRSPRLRQPRRHQARPAAARRTRGVLRDGAPLAFDLADRLQTPVFVMLDLDIGMNEWLCEPFEWDDSRTLRPRQGDELRGPGGRPASSAATSTSTATASPTAPIPACTPPSGGFFTRGTSRNRYARYSRGGRRLRRQHAAAAAQVRHRQDAGAAAGRSRPRQADPRTGVIYFGSTTAGHGRGPGGAGGARASTSTPCACAPSRSPTRSLDFIAAHDQVFVVEQNRDAPAAHAAGQRGRHRPGAAHPDPALRRHAHHRPLHRRRDRRSAWRAQRRPAEAAE